MGLFGFGKKKAAPQQMGSDGFKVYTPTSGVCDVCGKSIVGKTTNIVPNKVFYHSPKYRAHFAKVNEPMIKAMLGETQASTLIGKELVEQQLAEMESKDKSSGSAVCMGCIHMFK